MLTVNDLQTLEQSGRFDDARAGALDSLKSARREERTAGALFLIANMKVEFYPKALEALKPMKEQLAGDFNVCNAMAYAAWYNDDAELCRWASHRCMALNHAAPSGYIRLGMLELSKQRYADAFCALSAGLLHCQKDIAAFQPWYRLAKALMQGTSIVRFTCDGLEFSFRLSTFNGHAMETACQHILGHLCEEEELRYVRKFVGHCDSIVEVGAAVGNHSVFFAKALSPKTINVFDAFAPAVEHTRENLALNCVEPDSPRYHVHYAAVGSIPGRMRIFDQDIAVVRLDDELKERVDFVKIDVDGMEMEVLEGCRSLIARDRPKVMIEIKNELKNSFHTFIHEHDYVIEHEIVRPVDTNYFIKPSAAST